MEKLYPIVKFYKWVEDEIPESERWRYRHFARVLCPVCGRRLPKIKVDFKNSHRYFDYEDKLAKSTTGTATKPYHCEGCDSLIQPLS